MTYKEEIAELKENIDKLECNILVNECLPPEWGSIEDENGIRLIVENKDNLIFKKGYFKEDINKIIEIKEKAKDLKAKIEAEGCGASYSFDDLTHYCHCEICGWFCKDCQEAIKEINEVLG